MTTPLPCPFCGHVGVHVVERDNYRWQAAECDNCGAQAGEVRWIYYADGSKETSDAIAEMNALNEWNTRA